MMRNRVSAGKGLKAPTAKNFGQVNSARAVLDPHARNAIVNVNCCSGWPFSFEGVPQNHDKPSNPEEAILVLSGTGTLNMFEQACKPLDKT